MIERRGRRWRCALFSIVFFLVFFGYDVLFEVRSRGRTPGKRWTGLRVVRTGGQPVTFVPSCVRNVMRLVDFLPALYAIGMLSIFVTPRNQRLGDLAAGTLVMRDRPGGMRARSRRRARARAGERGRLGRQRGLGAGRRHRAPVPRAPRRARDGARAELAGELARRLRPLSPARPSSSRPRSSSSGWRPLRRTGPERVKEAGAAFWTAEPWGLVSLGVMAFVGFIGRPSGRRPAPRSAHRRRRLLRFLPGS